MSGSRVVTDSSIYVSNLLCRGHGMPLWQPNPLHPSPDYCAKGLMYGDVGYITNDGVFEFRFNALLPRNHPFQAYGVPDGFSPFESFLPAEIGGEFKDVVMEEDQWHDAMACIASEHAETKKIQVDGKCWNGWVQVRPHAE